MDERRTDKRIAVVPPDGAGTRLDRFLAEHFPRYSRGRIQEVIRAGEVRVNGRRARPGTPLEAGDRLELPRMSEAVATVERRGAARATLRRRTAMPTEVEVLHRDEDLLVVSKPPGVPVHAGAHLGTTKTLLELLVEDVVDGFGLVHRLDRDTSGAIALVRGEALRAAATARFADPEGGVRKVYEALVDGVPEPPAGDITLPLAPPGHRGKARVDPKEGRAAHTRYVTLEAFRDAARLEIELLSGRTHQIRAHLEAVGHPLLVDHRYGHRGGWMLRDPRGRLDARLRRTPLHAARLELPHPRTGTPIVIRAPLAADIRYALEVLRVDAGRQDPEEGRR